MTYRDFIQEYEDVSIKYITYWRQVRKMKISIAKLGEEECEICLEKDAHKQREMKQFGTIKCIPDLMNEMLNNVDCIANECELCKDYEKHIQRAMISRSEYKVDVETKVCIENNTVVAVDMQVVMLPRMPGVKRAVFTGR